MTTFSLGINTCFAVKRWPEPGRWAELVRAHLGLSLVQHTLDLVDFHDHPDWLFRQADQVASACSAAGLSLHSTFTGLGAYSGSLMLHPNAEHRDRAEQWFRRVIDFTARAGAACTGGHVGALSVDDVASSRSRELESELVERLERLTAYAHEVGLQSLLIENMAAGREPSTMAWVDELLDDGDAEHVPLRLCLDVGHQVVVGQSGDELDPVAWLKRFGRRSEVVHLQQSDHRSDHHWPFTEELNALGRIEASSVLAALRESGAQHVNLVLEIIPAFEADDQQVLRDLVASVAYWKRALGVA